MPKGRVPLCKQCGKNPARLLADLGEFRVYCSLWCGAADARHYVSLMHWCPTEQAWLSENDMCDTQYAGRPERHIHWDTGNGQYNTAPIKKES